MDELRQLKTRRDLLSAYLTAIGHIAEVIECCTGATSVADDDSADADEARANLMQRFGFTEFQADGVLLLQLRRLTPAQRERMRLELADVEERIARL